MIIPAVLEEEEKEEDIDDEIVSGIQTDKDIDGEAALLDFINY